MFSIFTALFMDFPRLIANGFPIRSRYFRASFTSSSSSAASWLSS